MPLPTFITHTLLFNSESEIKTRIQDILRSYRNPWDTFSELIQNSVDAINRRFRIMNDPDFYLYEELEDIENANEYTGKIFIEVFPDKKTIRISDNGTGIEDTKILSMLLPEGTDKKKGKEYGYKGKGLTYVAFSSNKFSIKTKHYKTNTTNCVALGGLFDWVADDTNTISFPTTPIPEVTTIDDIGEYNTVIELELDNQYKEKFTGLSSLDDAFSLLDEEKYDAFENLLRTKTAIGNTKYLFNKQPIVDIKIVLSVFDNDGNEIDIRSKYEKKNHKKAKNREIKYMFAHPKDFPIVNQLSYEFSDYVTNVLTKTGIDNKCYCLNYSKIAKQIGEKNPITVDIYLSAIFKKSLSDINTDDLGYNKEFLSAGGGYSSGVYLAIDGMPTGIRIDNWDKKGNFNLRYYAIVDCELSVSDELDSGRKGISAYRASQISDYIYDMRDDRITQSDGTPIGDKFSTYTRNLTSLSDDNDIDDLFNDEENDFEYRVEQARQQIQNDIDSYPDLVKFISDNTSLKHCPHNEEEVRTLFHELIAKGFIHGYSTLFDAANRSVYDTALEYNLEVNENTSQPGNKNGISHDIMLSCTKTKRKNLDLHFLRKRCKHHAENVLCTEYKFGLNELFYDILKPETSKRPTEMDIVICWDYTISPEMNSKCTYTIEEPRRNNPFFGVTHILRIINPDTTGINCICLKRFIEKILE